ncbi:MAG: DUF4269 domain-containing protein [Reyranella sp.]|jgi:hypothetical protein|uniref:DUF4269 domain-containing protein n=1 Tax=Reyranella sp. TaxID=1929291 RepID=UPI0025E942D5|nr:DUF4269 domain-containing protein [Reyranella sp.]MBR2813130.1 DUF4269 domain-containing protein [Reyranella sp.]
MPAAAKRLPYLEALARSGLMEALAPFDPHVAGTPPLGLDVPGSDIDVLCEVDEGWAFTQAIWAHAGEFDSFIIRQWTGETRPIVASFEACGWPIEIFGDPRPVVRQPGWRHFTVERRLLALGGEGFRAAVMAQRHRGLKTEPAFAVTLGLDGDPYLTLLELDARSDSHLLRRLKDCGFAGIVSGEQKCGDE